MENIPYDFAKQESIGAAPVGTLWFPQYYICEFAVVLRNQDATTPVNIETNAPVTASMNVFE